MDIHGPAASKHRTELTCSALCPDKPTQGVTGSLNFGLWGLGESSRMVTASQHPESNKVTLSDSAAQGNHTILHL